METDTENVGLHLILDVTVENDPFGTGDSPSQYYVNLISCVADNGEDYDFTNLSKYDVCQIEKFACEKVRGY